MRMFHLSRLQAAAAVRQLRRSLRRLSGLRIAWTERTAQQMVTYLVDHDLKQCFTANACASSDRSRRGVVRRLPSC